MVSIMYLRLSVDQSGSSELPENVSEDRLIEGGKCLKARDWVTNLGDQRVESTRIDSQLSVCRWGRSQSLVECGLGQGPDRYQKVDPKGR